MQQGGWESIVESGYRCQVGYNTHSCFCLTRKEKKQWFMRSRHQMVLKLELQNSKKNVSVTIIYKQLIYRFVSQIAPSKGTCYSASIRDTLPYPARGPQGLLALLVSPQDWRAGLG